MCRYGAAFHGATHARRDTFHCLLHSSRPFLSSLVFLARSPANNRPWRTGRATPRHAAPRRAVRALSRATFLALSPVPLLHLLLLPTHSTRGPPFPTIERPSCRSFSSSPPVLAFPFFSLHSSLLLPLLFVFFRRYNPTLLFPSPLPSSRRVASSPFVPAALREVTTVQLALLLRRSLFSAI